MAEFCYSDPTPDDTPPILAERRLLAAILQRAVLDLSGEAVQPLRVVEEAHDWIFSNAPISPFTFLHVCEQLDLCAESVRLFIRERMT